MAFKKYQDLRIYGDLARDTKDAALRDKSNITQHLTPYGECKAECACADGQVLGPKLRPTYSRPSYLLNSECALFIPVITGAYMLERYLTTIIKVQKFTSVAKNKTRQTQPFKPQYHLFF